MAGMFGGGGGAQPQQRQLDLEKVPVIPYEVLLADGKWHKMDAHNADVVEGVLVLANLVHMNEAGSIQRSMPHFFAIGEWRQCKTDYKGCHLSPLAI